MPRSIDRIAGLLLIAFVVLAGTLGYWAMSGAGLTARQDNPRRILAERRILRGPILDRDGRAIVETVGEPGAYLRRTIYPDAAPFTGYYSINYGTTGVEQAFDGVLRGATGRDPLAAYWDDVLHVNPAGFGAQLTIDLDVQRIADALLDGQPGAIVVLSIPGGEVLALSSRPTFDPNTLDDNWEALRADPTAPLLNRATQGQYQPGTAFQVMLLSEVLRRGVAGLDDPLTTPAEALAIDSQRLACLGDGDAVTLADAFRLACPLPLADLGIELGSQALWEIAATWHLTETTAIGIQSSAPITAMIPLTTTAALREFAAGQGPLTVTPLQMASVAATLAARGQFHPPRLISATQTTAGIWQSFDVEPSRRIVPVAAVEPVVAAMRRDGDVAWHAGIGLSGAEKRLWFLGFAPAARPEFAVALLLERGEDGAGSNQDVVQLGVELLERLAGADN
jgi:peptidoglycan glycosyltransferase